MVKLRAQDIDTKFNMIHTKSVKGLKDRQKFILILDTGYGWVKSSLDFGSR